MIVVVGVGRTGTTAIARVLQDRLGVDMGGPGDGSTHPGGAYEDLEIRKHTLRLTHGTIDEQEWVGRVSTIANGRKEPWGFKDPLLWRYLPLVHFLFGDAEIVWADREIVDTALSWAKNVGGFDLESAGAEVEHRRWMIRRCLEKKKHLRIDMTDHKSDEELHAKLAPLVQRKEAVPA